MDVLFFIAFGCLFLYLMGRRKKKKPLNGKSYPPLVHPVYPSSHTEPTHGVSESDKQD